MQRLKTFNLEFIPLLSLLLTTVLLAACSSSWKAPVSSANSSLPQQKTYQYLAGSRYYKVNSGDTLYGIAWQTGNEFNNLVKWNNLKSPYVIYPGQSLLVKEPQYTVSKTSQHKAKTKPAVNSTKTQTKKITKKQPATSNSTTEKRYASRLNWSWPTKGKVIQSFSYGDATKKGVMLSGEIGQPILAAESGKVVYNGSGLIGYGKLVIVKHNNKYLSAYGFNNKVLVKEGDWVTKGEKIATMGLSDKGLPGLHFEIRKSGAPVDPVKYLP